MPEIDQDIGALKAQVATLTKTLDDHARKIETALDRHGEESRQGRAKLYQAVEAIRLEASHTKRTAEITAGEFREWKTQVDTKIKRFEKWTERGIGAWMAIVAGSSVIVAALAYAWKAVVGAVSGLLPS